jgi:hypothetical protein
MTSPIEAMIDAVATCCRCGKTERGGCECWTPCACGWSKPRGDDGCSRCSAVAFVKAGRSEYEARIEDATVRTFKDGIHWRYAIRFRGDPRETVAEAQCGTNKGAQTYAKAEAFKALDSEPI